jgi:Aspartyl protease
VFYQGVVAGAFNDLHRCEKKLTTVIKSRPQSDEAMQAHRLLATAYLRQGKYREALAQVDALLALRPGDSSLGDAPPLLAALRGFPDHEVVRRRSTALELQDAGLPFSINGVQVRCWFDTGADASVLTESEAMRFGLRVLGTPIKVGGVTGALSDSRVAVADELSIGSIWLRHVVFRVLSDGQPPFDQLPPGSRGLIGIPVLLALQRFVWGADGEFERTDSYKMEGAGGAKKMDAAILSSLHFRIAGFAVVLIPADVLLTHTIENSKFFHGNLGIDLRSRHTKRPLISRL